MRSRIAVPDSLAVQPLLFGLSKPGSPFELVTDLPAKNAIALSERTGDIRCAFLSPIDYARHGGEYCIVPDVALVSSGASGTIQLLIKSDVRNITTLAVDVRVTSEIILAKIILMERYRNLPASGADLSYVPMLPDPVRMLEKADAALLVNTGLPPEMDDRPGTFTLDLVEEWADMTDLPYVHGFWVGRDEELTADEAAALRTAKREGVNLRSRIAADAALARSLPAVRVEEYYQAFTYDFGEAETQSLEEFIRYAYYHGAISDMPEVQFFDLGDDAPPPPAVN